MPLTSQIVEGAKALEKSVEKALTVAWDEVEDWQQDNHFIHTGYRPASGSFSKSFASLGHLHNESVNIYSHLLGAVIFVLAGGWLYRSIETRYNSAGKGDKLVFACFFMGAAVCLTMSGVYHTISNHSHTVARFGNKLDYVGIVFLITGSFVPSIYYGFYCHSKQQEAYWTMVCSTLRSFQHYNIDLKSRYAVSASGVPQYQSLTGSEHLLGVHIVLLCS